MPRALKVYRTAIGFDDAYVAAPSRKAALAAWGAKKDLFAIGSAELVTDPKLAADPLAAPGTVIRRSRGGLAEQLAAMPRREPASKPAQAAKSPARVKPPKPPPSRHRLEDAESALREFDTKAQAELAELLEREAQLRRERDALECRHEAAAKKFEQQLEREKARYDSALAKWRAESLTLAEPRHGPLGWVVLLRST